MKRIMHACLMQTIHFELKEEYENYKKGLERKNTKYLIESEKELPDGSMIVELKKQYNAYECGKYMG